MHCGSPLGVPRERIELGDPRFDSVLQRARALRRRSVRAVCEGRATLVAGSTWPADEDVLFSAFRLRGDPSGTSPGAGPARATPEHLERLDQAARRRGSGCPAGAQEQPAESGGYRPRGSSAALTLAPAWRTSEEDLGHPGSTRCWSRPPAGCGALRARGTSQSGRGSACWSGELRQSSRDFPDWLDLDSQATLAG
jgi:hypothetical protein